MPWSSAPARRVCTTRCPWRQFTGRRVAAVARGYGLRDKLARTSTRIARMVRVWPSVKLKRHGFECGRRRARTLPRTRPHVGHSSDTVGPLSGPADNGEHEPPDDISAAPDISLHCRWVAGCPGSNALPTKPGNPVISALPGQEWCRRSRPGVLCRRVFRPETAAISPQPQPG